MPAKPEPQAKPQSAHQTPAAYRELVRKRLGRLTDIFARAAVGDFSKDLTIPHEEDEFTELYAGIQIMLEVIREKTVDLEALNLRLSEEVREKAAELKAIVENSPQFVMQIDPELKLTYLNRTLPNLKYEDVIGTSVLNFVDPPERLRLTKLYRQVFRTGRPAATEVQSLGADGGKAWYKLSIAPIKEGDKIISLVVLSDDISDTKEAERRLRQRTEELEKFNALMVGRELKMTELKHELAELRRQLGMGGNASR